MKKSLIVCLVLIFSASATNQLIIKNNYKNFYQVSESNSLFNTSFGVINQKNLIFKQDSANQFCSYSLDSVKDVLPVDFTTAQINEMKTIFIIGDNNILKLNDGVVNWNHFPDNFKINRIMYEDNMFKRIVSSKKLYKTEFKKNIGKNSYQVDDDAKLAVLNLTSYNLVQYEFKTGENPKSPLNWAIYYDYKNYYLTKKINYDDFVDNSEKVLFLADNFIDGLDSKIAKILADIMSESFLSLKTFDWQKNIPGKYSSNLQVLFSFSTNSVIGYSYPDD